MKNVYDIVVNYKKQAYEFYEWDKNDNITHIKVIPSIKVTSKCILDFLNNDIVIKKDLIEKIKDKTEVIYKGKIKKINYSCILFDKNISLCILFDENGYMIAKSKLLFEESDDVIKNGYELKETKLEYKVLKTLFFNKFRTRNENKIIFDLNSYIDNIFKNNRYDELKYLHYECFDEELSDYNKIYEKLKEGVNEYNTLLIEKLSSLIKVLKK